MGLWDLQIIAFCFYLHFTKCPNFFGIGLEDYSFCSQCTPNLYVYPGTCINIRLLPATNTPMIPSQDTIEIRYIFCVLFSGGGWAENGEAQTFPLKLMMTKSPKQDVNNLCLTCLLISAIVGTLVKQGKKNVLKLRSMISFKERFVLPLLSAHPPPLVLLWTLGTLKNLPVDLHLAMWSSPHMRGSLE